jgi:hypothetical protein
MRYVYADNAATTPVSKKVVEAMLPYMTEHYGNPSSLYSIGQTAFTAVQTAREQVAAALGADAKEIFFTSGGSEADNWAIRGAAALGEKKGKKHLITTKFEHHAVLHTMAALEKQGFTVTYLDVYEDGLVRVEDVEKAAKVVDDSMKLLQTSTDAAEIKDGMKELTDNKEKVLNTARANSLAKSGEITAENYQKELYMFFRNGKDYKEKVSVDVKAVVNWLKTNKTKDTIKKLQNASDASFSNMINKAKSAENAANREGGDLGSAKASAFNTLVSVFTALHTINNTAVNAWKAAVNEQTSTYKSICVAALSKKNQNKDN